jgi:putative transposase
MMHTNEDERMNKQAGRLRSQGNEEQAGRLRSQQPWHSRLYLPHFDGPHVTQSVTFCLEGSIPQDVLDEKRDLLGMLKKDAAERAWRMKVEHILDKGEGPAHLRDARLAQMVQNALLFFAGTRYALHAWVVMPTHVHTLFTPFEPWSLARIMHSLKSFTAHEAAKLLGHPGRFWMPESFDRFIRDEAHYHAVVAYIEENPVNAGLCVRAEDWPWSSAAGSAGVSPAHYDEAGGTPALPGS